MKTITKTAFLLFFAYLSFYALFFSGHLGGDAYNMLLITESLTLRHSIDISPDRSFNIPEMARGSRSQLFKGKGERHFSKYGIGLPVMEVPFFFAGLCASKLIAPHLTDYVTMFSVSSINCVMTALLCSLIFLFSFEIFRNMKAALFLSIFFGVSSFALPHIKYGMAEPLLTLCFLSAIYLLFLYRQNGKRSHLILSGFFLGYTVLTKYYSLIFFPLFIIAVISLSLQKRKGETKAIICDCSAFISPLFAAICMIALYNYHRSGSPFVTGYTDTFTFSLQSVLMRLLWQIASPGKGLVFYFPGILLSIPAFLLLKKTDRFLAMFFLLLIGVNLYVVSNYDCWSGDLAWGLRYQYIILPLLIIPLGALLISPHSRTYYRLSIPCMAAGFITNLPPLLMNMADWRFCIDHIVGSGIYFNPLYSPITGGWIQIFSSINRYFSGNSLSLAINDQLISLNGFDRIDIWYVNIFSKSDLAPMIKVFTIIVLIMITVVFLISTAKILRAYREFNVKCESTGR